MTISMHAWFAANVVFKYVRSRAAEEKFALLRLFVPPHGKGHSKEKRTQPLIYCAISIIPSEFHTNIHAHTQSSAYGLHSLPCSTHPAHTHTHDKRTSATECSFYCGSAIVSASFYYSAHIRYILSGNLFDSSPALLCTHKCAVVELMVGKMLVVGMHSIGRARV